MKNRKNRINRQSGYTLIEVMYTIVLLTILAGVVTFCGTVAYVAYHFISRFW